MSSETMIKTSMELQLRKVGIIGCGWLGKALAKTLISNDYVPVGTTQHSENLAALNQLGIRGELLSLPIENFASNDSKVFDCYTLVICIPPGIRQGKTDYPEKISQIVSAAEQGCVEKIILISTTAIYGDLLGKVDESTTIDLSNAKVKLLNNAEQHVLAFNKQSIVIRCAGLVGENRHPGKFLRHKRMLSSPNAYVNLVHQQDVIGVLMELISSDQLKGILNLSSQMQVSKKHFYAIAASALDIPTPEFDEYSPVELGKQVMSGKIRDCIDYQFKYDDLVAWTLKKPIL